MPHTPAEAKFLSEEERIAAMIRLKEDSHGANVFEDVNDDHFRWHWVRMAFRAPQVYLCCLLWFFLLVPLYVSSLGGEIAMEPVQESSSRCGVLQSFSLFLPTIISGLGYHATTAQLFTVPPNMAAFFVVLANSILSDRIKARGPILAGGCIIAIAGYIMLLTADTSSVRYGGTFLVAVGVYPSSAMTMVSISKSLIG